MSSEIHKYIETAIDKKTNLFNAEVINFPQEQNIKDDKKLKSQNQNFWKISDESNADQLKAIIGICFMFSTLVLLGLYSNLS
tara:strand:- start:263 stop:508 length:246 start_codon:yes stop_codon:yes gene_type:complete